MAEAATFTRESLATYEKGPQKTVPNTTNPFKGATPAKQASAVDASVATGGESKILDIAPGGTPAGGETSTDDTPVVDEDGNLGDPTDSGEGTSDELTSTSSTDTVDHGDDADPNADLTGTQPAEEIEDDQPAKGSARERIVELNDKLEGAMVFGKTVQEAYKAAVEENARLRAERSTGTEAPGTITPPVVNSDEPGPMPDMADPDVAFDNDKYRAKMQKWSTANAQHAARQVVREMTGAAQANALVLEVNAKVETFAKDHPDFAEVVTNNDVLKRNQLADAAGAAVARSPYTADLLYKFGQDPGFAIRVAKMNPADQLIVIGEMIAEVKAEKKAGKTTPATPPSKQPAPANRGGAQPAAQRKSVSQAPPPPRAIPAGGRSVAFNPLDPNTSMDDFVNDHRKGKQSARAENRRLRGLN